MTSCNAGGEDEAEEDEGDGVDGEVGGGGRSMSKACTHTLTQYRTFNGSVYPGRVMLRSRHDSAEMKYIGRVILLRLKFGEEKYANSGVTSVAIRRSKFVVISSGEDWWWVGGFGRVGSVNG